MRRTPTPPAWYRDPTDARIERWWDGSVWTDATREVGPVDYLWGTGAPTAPPPPPPPSSSSRRGARRPGAAVLVAAGVVVALGAAAAGLAAAGLGPASPPGVVGSPAAASVMARPTPIASTSTTGPSASPAGSPSATGASADAAVAVLATLLVKGPAPMTGYSRASDFGPPWFDVDRNGCDTRNDILRRDLTDVTGTRCRVASGVLDDPYTGSRIDFRRGNTTSTLVQIDHVVALADAWRTGAQQLTQRQRVALSNDPINLLAVDGPTNEQKSDGDAATWLPPNKSFRCAYVAHQIAVKKAYALWVTPAERDAMLRILATCPPVAVPSSSVVADAERIPTPTPTAAIAPEASPAADLDPRYRYCSEAKRAGARTPYIRGEDPEYAWYRDADGDGAVCE